MENRIFVGTREDSIAFFKDVKNYGKFLSYRKLYPLLKIRHGEFWNLQTGRRSLQQSQYELLVDFLPTDLQEKYQKMINSRPKNWGMQKGGKVTSSRYPEQMAKARLKAIAKTQAKAANRFDINQPLTTDVCEFLGAFSGDAFTNRYGRHYQIGFSGDKRFDDNYYQTKIIPIVKKYFNIQTQSISTRKNGMWVNFHCKLLFEMLTQRFQMPAGEKWDTVLIPQEILQSKMEHKIAFVRGVLDTDGCVFFDNRKTYKEPYMRVDICMYNVPILTQIQQILTELGIKASVLGNGKHLQIVSKKDVRKFFEKIGSSNERHRTKIRLKYPDFDEWNPALIPVS